MISPALFYFSWEAIQEVPLLRIKITGQGDEEHIKYQFEWYWYPIELEIKDTTETDSCTSYLDLHIDIDSVGRLRTKLYDNRNEFNFPIVNFPFICSKIPAAPALWNICDINDHGYVPLVVSTSQSFPHSRLITGLVTRLTRRVQLVEQELLTLPEHLRSPRFLMGFVLLDF